MTVRIEKGSSLSAMGSTLADAGVVFNSDAFVRAANKNDDAATIQPGTYTMKSKMSGAAAVTALLSPRNRVVVKVTIPEGTRAVDVYAILAKKSGLPVKDFQAAAAKPADLGLPSYAKSVEGYLFPATYTFEPNSSADVMLRATASRYLDEADKLGLANAAKRHGLTVGQLVTVASLAQAEVNRPEYYGKVTRVVYNRLAKRMKLKFDTSAKYAHGYDGKGLLTAKQLHEPGPYNLYQHYGLPPTPIDSPGAEALGAAVDPTPGAWLYFVAVDLNNGRTEFSLDDAGFEKSRQKLMSWCSVNKGRC